MKALIARFSRHEAGVTAIQYGLVAALVAVALIVGAKGLGSQVKNTFNSASTKMKNA